MSLVNVYMCLLYINHMKITGYKYCFVQMHCIYLIPEYTLNVYE